MLYWNTASPRGNIEYLLGIPIKFPSFQLVNHLSAYDEGPVPNVFLETARDPDVEHGYWLDIRDLLLYGDQYINYAVGTEMPFVSLPAANGMRRYASSAEIDDFFSGTAKGFETDGIMSLSIMSRQKASTSGLVLGKS